MRQSENVFPVLFAIYLIDVEICLIDEQCRGVNIYDNVLIDLLKFLFYCMPTTVIFAQNNTDIITRW